MNPKNSQDLFNKIRSQFSNIRLGDQNGAATADPSNAVFFEFEFQEDADTFGSVSISLADGENMKVYYNRDLVSKIDEDSRDEWYAFLKELKDFADLQEEFKDQITVIAIDRAESLKTAKGFSDAQGITDKMVFLLDPEDSFYKTIGRFGMPETIFVNSEGEVTYHKVGFMDLKEMRRRTKDLLEAN